MSSSPERPTRRRALTILAAAAAGTLLGGPARSSTGYEWSGVAMGADARILFNGIERDAARAAIELVEDREQLPRGQPPDSRNVGAAIAVGDIGAGRDASTIGRGV